MYVNLKWIQNGYIKLKSVGPIEFILGPTLIMGGKWDGRRDSFSLSLCLLYTRYRMKFKKVTYIHN